MELKISISKVDIHIICHNFVSETKLMINDKILASMLIIEIYITTVAVHIFSNLLGMSSKYLFFQYSRLSLNRGGTQVRSDLIFLQDNSGSEWVRWTFLLHEIQ